MVKYSTPAKPAQDGRRVEETGAFVSTEIWGWNNAGLSAAELLSFHRIHRNRMKRLISTLAVIGAGLWLAGFEACAATKPNVLFLLADDLRPIL